MAKAFARTSESFICSELRCFILIRQANRRAFRRERVRAGRKDERWGYLTFEGIVGILAGLAAFAWPGLTVLVFVGLVAAWALVTGVLELRAAFDLKRDHGRGWSWAGSLRLFSEYCSS